MVSILLRPPEVDKREMPGHWEGDLIKGKNNGSAVGTLVELSSGYLILAKMNDATATSAIEGFSAALNRMPQAVRNTMTYDQGREMAPHAKITQKTGLPSTSAIRIAHGSGVPTRISMGFFANICRREPTCQAIARKN
jgi:IS30 family transposase